MSDERTTAWKADFHRNDKVGRLSTWGKILYRYLGDAAPANRSGIFEVDLDEAAAATGIPRNLLPHTFEELAGIHEGTPGSPLIRFDGKVVWVVGRWKHYIAPGPKQRARIGHEFLARPHLPFWPEFFQRYGDVAAHCQRDDFKQAREFHEALEHAATQLRPVRHYTAPEIPIGFPLAGQLISTLPPNLKAQMRALPDTYAVAGDPSPQSFAPVNNFGDNLAQPSQPHQKEGGIEGYPTIPPDTLEVAAPVNSLSGRGRYSKDLPTSPPHPERAHAILAPFNLDLPVGHERLEGRIEFPDLDTPPEAPGVVPSPLPGSGGNGTSGGLFFDQVVARIARIANVFELRNWKRKHAGEIDALNPTERDAVKLQLSELEQTFDLGPVPADVDAPTEPQAPAPSSSPPERHAWTCSCEGCFDHPERRETFDEFKARKKTGASIDGSVPAEDPEARKNRILDRVGAVTVETNDMQRYHLRMQLVSLSVNGQITHEELQELLPLVRPQKVNA